MSNRGSAMAQKIGGKNWSVNVKLESKKKKAKKITLQEKIKNRQDLKQQRLEKNWTVLIKRLNLHNQKQSNELNNLKEKYLNYSPKYQREINNAVIYYRKHCKEFKKDFNINTFLLNIFNVIYTDKRYLISNPEKIIKEISPK
ncbi:hypothetical protein Q2490_15145 [Myroides odoratimimus]|uniref:hypothetical protein n=1 Tax=Myroides odoratimimus TaxID=76832 RepID=UPI0026E0CD5C|nr:hypothetical protein [Myroides odoratimimus]MDO5858620.1 hypothetical protein [Myroides odoratimimus]